VLHRANTRFHPPTRHTEMGQLAGINLLLVNWGCGRAVDICRGLPGPQAREFPKLCAFGVTKPPSTWAVERPSPTIKRSVAPITAAGARGPAAGWCVPAVYMSAGASAPAKTCVQLAVPD